MRASFRLMMVQLMGALACVSNNPPVILEGARTPMGAFMGQLKEFAAPKLAGHVIQSMLANTPGCPVSEVILGNVLSAGLGQAPARQAVQWANLPNTTPAHLINKVCGSSMQAIFGGVARIALNPESVVVAGGMESMSRAPYLLPKARSGMRLGHTDAKDHLFLDGIEDASQPGTLMGCFADNLAAQHNLSRTQQDNYAVRSAEQALHARENGWLKSQLAPIVLSDKSLLTYDEPLDRVKLEKIPHLKPAFCAHGTVTAASSSALADGAAAVLLTSMRSAERMGVRARARICGLSTCAGEPSTFALAPIGAVQELLKTLNWSVCDVSIFEVNEAFAMVPLAFAQTLNVPQERLNVWGGACALGHPLGASGARIVVNLLHILEQQNLRRGIAAICVGGGEGLALALERL